VHIYHHCTGASTLPRLIIPYSFGFQSNANSITELGNHGNATLCPPHGRMLLHHTQFHGDNVICGVTGGRKDTETGKCLVDWSLISVIVRYIVTLGRLEPNLGHLCEQDLRS